MGYITHSCRRAKEDSGRCPRGKVNFNHTGFPKQKWLF